MGSVSFKINLSNNTLANSLEKLLPLVGDCRRWGDEIYFYTDIDLPEEKGAKEVFKPGDLVYWKSRKNNKKAIALFFGNTPIGDETKPLAASPASLFGTIKIDYAVLSRAENGEKLSLIK